MPRDYYKILGVQQTATDASIRRAIQAARDQITADQSLSPATLESRLAELQAAGDVLSSPDKRDQYDADLRGNSGASTNLLLQPRTWFALIAVFVIGSGLYWQYDRAQTNQRLERERIAAEQEQERRLKQFEEQRVAEKKRLEEELRAQRDADDKARQEVNEMRSAETQKKQYVTDDRNVLPVPPSADSVGRGYDDQRQMGAEARRLALEERKQRMEDEANLRRANAEVERQKRFLEQLEREEQYARIRREAASSPGR
jgi:curved DNA-binding protein CbpA